MDLLSTKTTTVATAQLYEHLNSTATRYPGTNLILKYETKTKAPVLIK